MKIIFIILIISVALFGVYQFLLYRFTKDLSFLSAEEELTPLQENIKNGAKFILFAVASIFGYEILTEGQTVVDSFVKLTPFILETCAALVALYVKVRMEYTRSNGLKVKGLFPVVAILMLSTAGQAQGLLKMFKPVEKPSVQMLTEEAVVEPEFRFLAITPSIKIQKANEVHVASIISSIGSGVSYNWIEYKGDNHKTLFSLTPLAFLVDVTSSVYEDEASSFVDLSAASYVGFLNNTFQVGLGKTITGDGSWFGVLSVGISL